MHDRDRKLHSRAESYREIMKVTARDVADTAW